MLVAHVKTFWSMQCGGRRFNVEYLCPTTCAKDVERCCGSVHLVNAPAAGIGAVFVLFYERAEVGVFPRHNTESPGICWNYSLYVRLFVRLTKGYVPSGFLVLIIKAQSSAIWPAF